MTRRSQRLSPFRGLSSLPKVAQEFCHSGLQMFGWQHLLERQQEQEELQSPAHLALAPWYL